METVLEMESSLSQRSFNENRQSSALERSEVLVTKLARFYSVMGHRPEEPGALACMAEILTQSATDEQIDGALTRCARECRYPVRVPDILQRIPGHEIPQSEAETRKAWDVLMAFVSKYVGNDVHGSYGPEHGWYQKRYPKLSDRLLDTVRRTGGWRAYKCMTDDDFPFQQKRFFEEYAAWTAVEQIEPTKLLTEIPRLQLVAKPIDPPMITQPKTEQPKMPPFKPEPMTDAQFRDRREILRQQAASLLAKERNCQKSA